MQTAAQVSVTGIWPTGDGRWCVVGALAWECGRPGSSLWIAVPDGFVTDLASIPRWLHWLVNPYDPATAPAAILHDWLLWDETEQRVAAGEFYRRLILDGFPRWKAKAFFLAVLLASTD